MSQRQRQRRSWRAVLGRPSTRTADADVSSDLARRTTSTSGQCINQPPCLSFFAVQDTCISRRQHHHQNNFRNTLFKTPALSRTFNNMPACGSDPSLCQCPERPIPMSSRDISLPQHPCTLRNYRKACHGCGHSCGHEYDAVERHLDKEKMRREGAESSNTNDGVICNGCYGKYKLVQEIQDGVGEKRQRM